MAILLYKGKFYLICLLLFLDLSCTFSTSFANPDDTHITASDPAKTLNLLNQHIAQLGKLEELVKNLAQLVARLESRVLEFPNHEVKNFKNHEFVEEEERVKAYSTENGDESQLDDEGFVREEDEVEGPGVRSVTKHSLFWSERFKLVSAVKLDTNPTCVNVLPFRDAEGLSKYVAVGDELGKVYVFTRLGEVVLQFDTLANSPVTAMLSYISVFKNESMLVAGSKNGFTILYRVWEITNGDESNSLQREEIRELEQENGLEVTMLEVHHVGRMRYILLIDMGGTITIFKEGGSVIGRIKPSSRPLAFLRQKLLFLTKTGAGSLDLRTMKLREAPCEGLNGSYASNYVFDASDRAKAYGFTAEGELIHLLIYGDSTNFKCRVRIKRKFEEDFRPLALEAIKGYFLIVNQEKVCLYNVSSQHYARVGLPRFVFSAGLDEIVSSFLNYQELGRINTKKVGMIPLIASDHEKMVILSLGSGYIGMYSSNLPVARGDFNTMSWSTPVLFFILFLFAAWHFFANKKEALTSWGPDDPFTNGVPPSSSVERTFGDSTTSRNHDMMGLRGGGSSNAGGLRGPSRRYGSPSRYSGPSGNSFRPTPTDTNPRPASVDPNFRAASELKFRGSSIESSGFGKRRESMFVNSQVVNSQVGDDHGN